MHGGTRLTSERGSGLTRPRSACAAGEGFARTAGGCQGAVTTVLLSQVYIQLVVCRASSSSESAGLYPMGKKQSGLFRFDCPVLLQELNGWAGSETKAWCVRDTLVQYWFLVLPWLHVKLFSAFIIILIFMGARKGFCYCAL